MVAGQQIAGERASLSLESKETRLQGPEKKDLFLQFAVDAQAGSKRVKTVKELLEDPWSNEFK